MSQRLIIQNIEPSAIKVLLKLEQYLDTVSVSKTNQYLIKIRASQINGCTYCIDMHSKHALQFGEMPERIDLISSWRNNTNSFSQEEQLLLAVTEEITLINEKGLSDDLYSKTELLFGQKQMVQIVMVVITINAWNRLVVSFKSDPSH